jgi:hypothetical protein
MVSLAVTRSLGRKRLRCIMSLPFGVKDAFRPPLVALNFSVQFLWPKLLKTIIKKT